MVASIPNGALRDEFNQAGQISARAETETETEDFAQFRPGGGAEAPVSKFAAMAAEVTAVEQPVVGGRNLSGAKATVFKVGGRPLAGELEITYKPLGAIEGKLFRLRAYEAIGAFELGTDARAVAIRLFPAAGDPDFSEPVVLLLRLENVEAFIQAIRIAQAGLPADMQRGGAA